MRVYRKKSNCDTLSGRGWRWSGFFDIEVFGVAAEDAEGDRADQEAAEAEAGPCRGVIVGAADERFVELRHLAVAGEAGVVGFGEPVVGGYDVEGDAVLMLGIEVG